MKRIKRIISKISLSTVFFFLLSIVSLTFAWFAYRGTTDVDMNLEVLAWHISFEDESTTVNFQIDDVKPGMTDYVRQVKIENKGDVEAFLSYKIKKLRVLNNVELTESDDILAAIATFPFELNMYFTEESVKPGYTKYFACKLNWEFEDGNDQYDTEWGERVNEFILNEQELHNADSTYVIRKPIEIEVELTARQAKAITFTIDDKSYRTRETNTWVDWIMSATYGMHDSNSNGILWITVGYGMSDDQIRSLNFPYSLDTRANNRYAALYLESSRPSQGGPPQKVLIDSTSKVQTLYDTIIDGMTYTGKYDSGSDDPCCFDPGTKILLANGKEKNIEDVKTGEYVMSYNELTKKYEPNKVIKEITKHNSDDLVYVFLSNGQRIGMRAYHPLLTEDGYKSLRPELAQTTMEVGYKVEQLKVGDKLIGMKGNPRVVSIESRKTIENYDTYNLSVENNHNYIANGVVVHNADCPI